MNKYGKIIISIIAFAVVFLLIWMGYKADHDKQAAFEAENTRVANFSSSTLTRVTNSVITLPDDTLIVGLKNGVGEYTQNNKKGTVTIKGEYLKTKFIPGVYKTTITPRLDAVVPMDVSNDSSGNSLYVVLFQDRGDATLEKSYARLGDSSTIVKNINTIPGDTPSQEYKVVITYTSSNTSKEITIPVVDGHFDSKGVISN